MKKCSKCKELKPFEDFNKNKSKKDGLNTYCKDCNKSYNKKHYIDNKESYFKSSKVTKKRNREFINEYKNDLKCSLCPERHNACLDFHHENDDKEMDIASMVSGGYSIERIEKEIKKCIVVCSNCHRKIHYKNKLLTRV